MHLLEGSDFLLGLGLALAGAGVAGLCLVALLFWLAGDDRLRRPVRGPRR